MLRPYWLIRTGTHVRNPLRVRTQKSQRLNWQLKLKATAYYGLSGGGLVVPSPRLSAINLSSFEWDLIVS